MTPQEALTQVKLLEKHIEEINKIVSELAVQNVLIQYNPIEYNRQSNGCEYNYLDFRAYVVMR